VARFDDRATSPRRGPGDMFRWKVMDALRGKKPKDPGGFVMPQQKPDLGRIRRDEGQLTWVGHASFLLTLGGQRILIDPIFAPRIGPIKRLLAPGIDLDVLPSVDLVLLTHNHRPSGSS